MQLNTKHTITKSVANRADRILLEESPLSDSLFGYKGSRGTAHQVYALRTHPNWNNWIDRRFSKVRR
jgi:hypothetical protein